MQHPPFFQGAWVGFGPHPAKAEFLLALYSETPSRALRVWGVNRCSPLAPGGPCLWRRCCSVCAAGAELQATPDTVQGPVWCRNPAQAPSTLCARPAGLTKFWFTGILSCGQGDAPGERRAWPVDPEPHLGLTTRRLLLAGLSATDSLTA